MDPYLDRRSAGALLALAFGIFVLPFAVPTHGDSISYLVGFSNRAALLCLLVGSLAIALRTRFGSAFTSPTTDGETVGPRAVTAGVVASVVCCVAVWFSASKTQPDQEATYFLDRYQHLLLGQHVYRDFSFDYGPLLFEPTVWLGRVLSLELQHAYYLAWTVQWVLGVLLIAYVVNRLGGTRTAKIMTFAFSVALWLTSVVDGGANYTPLRFIASSAVAVLAVAALKQGNTRRFLAYAIGGFFCLFLYSVEQGIAFSLATMAYLVCCTSGRRKWSLTGCVVAAVAIAFAFGAKLRLLDTLRLFGGGDYDLPVLFTPVTCAWAAAVLVAVCIAVRCWREGDADRPECFLVLLGLAALPAAMGRADPGHLFINTMPALIVTSLCLLSSPRSSRFSLSACAWGIALFSSFSSHTVPLRRFVITTHSTAITPEAKTQAEFLQKHMKAGDVVLAPFGYPLPFDLKQSRFITSGQYVGYTLVSHKLPELKIAELLAQPDKLLVVPGDYKQMCEPLGDPQAQGELGAIFGQSVSPTRNRQVTAPQGLCTFVDAHYSAVPELAAVPMFRVLQRDGR